MWRIIMRSVSDAKAMAKTLRASLARRGLAVSHGECLELVGDANPGATTFVWTTGLDAFHAELIDKRYPYTRPPIEPASWGRCLEVTDPFGNSIRFSEATA
jgi:hypothetical protein